MRFDGKSKFQILSQQQLPMWHYDPVSRKPVRNTNAPGLHQVEALVSFLPLLSVFPDIQSSTLNTPA